VARALAHGADQRRDLARALAAASHRLGNEVARDRTSPRLAYVDEGETAGVEAESEVRARGRQFVWH
jgi:hypothetical protein